MFIHSECLGILGFFVCNQEEKERLTSEGDSKNQ